MVLQLRRHATVCLAKLQSGRWGGMDRFAEQACIHRCGRRRRGGLLLRDGRRGEPAVLLASACRLLACLLPACRVRAPVEAAEGREATPRAGVAVSALQPRPPDVGCLPRRGSQKECKAPRGTRGEPGVHQRAALRRRDLCLELWCCSGVAMFNPLLD